MLLSEGFPHAYGEAPLEEMYQLLDAERIALVALDDSEDATTTVVGYIGAIPQYGITGWEMHPLVVRQDMRSKGLGTLLVKALEQEVAKRGGLTIYLGTDDEFEQTSLSQTDLFVDTYQKIERIVNLKRHPYEFYQRIGYKIVGVIPDANGPGKPDIWMAKRVSID